MHIYLGSDHAGYDLKMALIAWLNEQNLENTDLGNKAYDKADDYPDYAHPVAEEVVTDPANRGILLCGNAEGVCVVANKTKGARAALGFSVEATRLARNDDDVNILCLPGRMMDAEEAVKIVEAFLNTPFSNDERHVRRLGKLKEIEEKNFRG